MRRRNEQDAIEIELVGGRARGGNVSAMNGVEGPPKKSESQFTIMQGAGVNVRIASAASPAPSARLRPGK